MRVCKGGDEEGVIEMANGFEPKVEQRDVFGSGMRARRLQRYLRRHFDMGVARYQGKRRLLKFLMETHKGVL